MLHNKQTGSVVNNVDKNKGTKIDNNKIGYKKYLLNHLKYIIPGSFFTAAISFGLGYLHGSQYKIIWSDFIIGMLLSTLVFIMIFILLLFIDWRRKINK